MKKRKYFKFLDDQLEVKKGTAGLGLFTTKPIKKGQIIVEYKGPLLTDEEMEKKGGQYLFALGKDWTIDGSARDNIARYINHWCVKTNCEPIQYAQRIKIRAKRNIKPGEELHYDYGPEFYDEFIKGHCNCPKHKPSFHKKSRK